MGLHERYGLTKVINTRGTFTPLRVSRSSAAVGAAVAEALGEFFVVDELQDLVGHVIARDTGAEIGCVTHCASAAITPAGLLRHSRSMPIAAPNTIAAPSRIRISQMLVVETSTIASLQEPLLQTPARIARFRASSDGARSVPYAPHVRREILSLDNVR